MKNLKKDKLLNIANEVLATSNNNIIKPPDIPNTMNFWHGGNLDEYNDIITQKTGRYQYGVGLYLTSHYDTARKYAKGGRKLYLITVKEGVDINKAKLNSDVIKEFVNSYISKNMRKMIWERLQGYIKNNEINAYIFNNMMSNEKAIKPINTQYLRNFYIENGIDYDIIDNAFGWGERMMVLYNMKKIVNIIKITPKDKITVYDLA